MGLIGLLAVVLAIFYLIVLPIVVFGLSSRVKELEKRLSGAPEERRRQPKQEDYTKYYEEAPPISATSPRPMAASAPRPSAEKTTQKPAKPARSFEEQMGGHVFQWVGIGALVLALLFFLKWSFDNGLIGPVGRTVIGYVFAGAAIVAGDRLRSRYGIWSLAFTGGGALGAYIVTSIGLHTYQLFPPIVAFSINVLTTAVTCLLAGYYGAIPLAAFGILGGFATPFLVGGDSSTVALLLYILVLDLGVLALSHVRPWRKLNALALVGTFLYEFYAYSRFQSPYPTPSDLNLNYALLFTSAFLVIYGFVPFLYNLMKKQASEAPDILILVSNALVHFVFILLWLNTVPGLMETYDALVALVFAIAFLIFSNEAYRSNRNDTPFVLASLSLTILFASLAIPMQFGGMWVPLAWSIEGAFLLWIALHLRDPRIQRYAWILMAASYFWYFVIPSDTVVVWQLGTLSPTAFLPSGMILFFVWLVFALAILWVGLGRKDRHEQQLLPFALVGGAVLACAFGLNLFAPIPPLTWTQRFVEAVGLIGAGYVALAAARSRWSTLDDQEKTMFSALGIVVQIITLSYLTREFVRAVDERLIFTTFQNPYQALQVGISILWAVYASIALVIGITGNWKPIRIFAIVLLLIATVKLAIIDLFSLGTGARVIGFTVLGALLIGASFLYQRKKDALKSFFLS